MDNTVNKYLTLFNRFSCTVKKAEEAITDITKGALDLLDGARKQHNQQGGSQNLPSPPQPPQPLSPQTLTSCGITHLDDPVSICQCDMSDITVNDLMGELSFDTVHPGGRKTTYFGQVPYSYGKFHHPQQIFPQPNCSLKFLKSSRPWTMT